MLLSPYHHDTHTYTYNVSMSAIPQHDRTDMTGRNDTDTTRTASSSRHATWSVANGEMDILTLAMLQNVKEMQDAHARLREAYEQLQRDHDDVQARYAKDKDDWRTFKTWWHDKMKAKRQDGAASSVSSSSDCVANGAAQTPANHTTRSSNVPSSHVEKSSPSPSRSVLSETKYKTPRTGVPEHDILRRVGLRDDSEEDGDGVHPLPTPSRGPTLFTPLPSAAQHSRRSSVKRSRLSSEVVAKDPLSTFDKGVNAVLRDRTNNDSSEKSVASEASRGDELASTSKQSNPKPSPEKENRKKTINAEFELVPEQNGNIPYLHKEVVRGKEKRKNMHAHDCECCEAWYDAVGPVAIRPYEDTSRTGAAAVLAAYDNDDSNVTLNKSPSTIEKQRRQEHLQRTSRHRAYGPPASTPPGYWEIAFPTTQRVQELNDAAREKERQRRELMENDPRFRRRQ